MARTKPQPRLIPHRTVAAWLSVNPSTVRDWVADGEFPEPRAVIKTTWFYDAAQVEIFIKTGTWPDGTRFKPGLGKGRSA